MVLQNNLDFNTKIQIESPKIQNIVSQNLDQKSRSKVPTADDVFIGANTKIFGRSFHLHKQSMC